MNFPVYVVSLALAGQRHAPVDDIDDINPDQQLVDECLGNSAGMGGFYSNGPGADSPGFCLRGDLDFSKIRLTTPAKEAYNRNSRLGGLW